MKRLFAAICLFALVPLLPAASAQDNGAPRVADEAAVWSIVERAWRGERDNDSDWVDDLLSPAFVGWSTASPAPRDRASTRQWNNFASKQQKLIEYELYPLSIVVHGDTAVAHYLFASARQDRGQPVESITGRYTDVLVRTADGWRFLARHGGADGD